MFSKLKMTMDSYSLAYTNITELSQQKWEKSRMSIFKALQVYEKLAQNNQKQAFHHVHDILIQ